MVFRNKVVRVLAEKPNTDDFLYGIRHGDDDWDTPLTVEQNVVINKWGYIVSSTPLGIEGEDIITLTEEEQEQFKEELDRNTPKKATVVFDDLDSENEMTRTDFMKFFRDTMKLNELSVEDRIEVFQTILLGASDITKRLLDGILNDYCVSNLEIKEV